MSIPYKVTVKSNGKDVKVNISPQPIATKTEFATVVTGRFQRVLLSDKIRNTIMGRVKLKNELLEILEDFHAQGLIRPKEKEESE